MLHGLPSLLLFLTFGLVSGPAGAEPSPWAPPRIDAFAPLSGAVGSSVTITGRGLRGATRVTFGGAAARFTQQGRGSLRATVPMAAQTGTITVITRLGTATSSGVFIVTGSQAPVVSSFSPSQGPVGTVVTVLGSGFTAQASAAFQGKPALVTYVSASQLKVTVPAGAASGPIAITTATGTGFSSASFTVTSVPPSGSLDLSLAGWYLNQGSQTLARSVPLVAGKSAFLRVFPVASGANAAAPRVQVRITGGSPSPWEASIAAPKAAVPTSLSEADLASSWNVRVPGAVLAPGGTLTLTLDPDGTVADANPGNNVVSASLDVRKLGVFRTTLIPVTQQGLTGNAQSGGRTLASWAGPLQAMYPVGDPPAYVDVALGSPYSTQANLNDSSGSGWNTLLTEINAKRTAEGTGRYYYGVVAVSYSGGLAGLGYIGAPAAIGWDKTGYGDVFAHEVGHNFNRQHAPCGLSGADPNWPTDAAHASAQIGAYGYDVTQGQAKGPTAFKDLMSYCSPIWVSDYTYLGVLNYRAAGHFSAADQAESAETEGEPALPAKTECLLVSGQVRQGHLSVDPAYLVMTRPEPPPCGEYLLELKDRAGRDLLRVPFATTAVADGADADLRSFCFAVPLTCAQQVAYHSLAIRAPAGGWVSHQAGSGNLEHPPTATILGPGQVRLNWDHQAFPTVMVRDSSSGEILAFGRGGQLDVASQAEELELTLSDGVRSRRLRLRPVSP